MVEKELKERYEDEIDLYELLLVLKKRAKWVVGTFIIGVIVGTVISFLMPNIYQARATLWVDSLLIQSFLENLQLSNIKDTERFSFIIPLQQEKPQDINNLSLSILNSLEFKRKVLINLKQYYGNRNEKELLNLERAIDSGNGEKLFKADIDKKTQSILLISEQKSRELAESILRIAIEEFKKELEKASMAYSKVSSLKNKGEGGSFVLYVVEEPNSIKEPVKPKRGLIIAVSAVSSLFFGIFLAFVVEWWSNIRQNRSLS